MAHKGHTYGITDPKSFFTAVLFGTTPPSSSYGPLGFCKVELIVQLFPFFSINVTSTATVNDTTGKFELTNPSGILISPETSVAIYVTCFGLPAYRSEWFEYSKLPSELDIYMYPFVAPASAGVTAGQISGVLGSSLPGDTTISSNSGGLLISGSDGQVSLQFGLSIVPDTSQDLSAFLDVVLASYDVSVGWPTDWFESAGDVVNSIKSGVQSAGTAANALVATTIATVLENAEGLTPTLAKKLIADISLIFQFVQFKNHHWGISDTSDSTVVLMPSPCIGWPRKW